jgi:hypothetical protein
MAARAWRRGPRWHLAVGPALAITGILGRGRVDSLLSALRESVGWLSRLVGPHLPKGAAAWGVATVALAFLLLALGLRRSLKTNQPQGGSKW